MQRTRTTDRGPPAGVVEVHTVEQLGPNMSKLPNGNLLCRNVPVARVGWLIYGPGEVPVKAGSQGVAYVERTTDTLFNDKTLGSIMGAAVTIGHPPVDVTPANFKTYGKGFAFNVRKGTGDDAEVALADLMLTDHALIADVLAGKREVSLGYDADYRDNGGGIGQQHNITANHIALVERGRCGPRCAIGDREYQLQPPATSRKGKEMNRVKLNKRTADSQAVIDARAALAAAEADGEGEDGATHIHIHTGDSAPRVALKAGGEADPTGAEDRLTALETGFATVVESLAEIATSIKTIDEAVKAGPLAAKTGDETSYKDDDESDEAKAWREKMKKKTGDRAALETGYQALMAQAEVLVPGFRTPTFDAAAVRATTIDRMCQTRKTVLGVLDATEPGKALLDAVDGTKTRDFATMDCADAAVLFKAAAAAKALGNNRQAIGDSKHVPVLDKPVGGAKMPTAAEINEANKKFWEARGQ